jgi:protein-S-isoprenylcysteine O-methyltransferase Ste14
MGWQRRIQGARSFEEAPRIEEIGNAAGAPRGARRKISDGCSHLTGACQTTSLPGEGKAGALQKPTRAPASCTRSWINLVGAASLIGATLVLARFNLSVTTIVLITLTVPAVTIVILENLFIKSRIAFRPVRATGYVAAPIGLPPSQRVILKVVGVAASIGAMAAIYWLFPVYRDGGAKDLFLLAERLLIPFLLLAPLYIWYVDKKSEAPEDGYFHIGLLLTGSWPLADRHVVQQHCLQWLVKAFFLPLMLGIYVSQIVWLSQHPIEKALGPFLAEPTAANWFGVYRFLYSYLFIIDVGVACIGYALTLKLFDSEIRSAEPTLLGWVTCVLCYAPFWGLIGQQYLKYGGNNRWEVWLADWPAVKVTWSLLILILLGIYAWATVQFGIRFSNLTHRGILTNGPYRWLKHPAYVSKNASYWLMSLPFLAAGEFAEGLRLSLLLVGVNLVYYLRARTEEAHLMVDPIYRQYMRFMRNNDVFAFLRSFMRRMPALVRNHARK